MNAADKKAFFSTLLGLADYYKQPLAEASYQIYWNALASYPFEAVDAALQAHVADQDRGKWMPKVADVVHQIQSAKPHDGHPAPNEAWAIVAACINNETETVFITEPMREAWAKAAAVMKLGDEVGARMAFLETYASALSVARRNGEKPKWAITLGTDMEKRAMAVRSALAAKQITQDQANALLPSPEPARVMGLLESAAKAAKDPDTAKKGLEALKAAIQRMETRVARQEQERLEQMALERAELQRLKDEAVKALLEKEKDEKAA